MDQPLAIPLKIKDKSLSAGDGEERGAHTLSLASLFSGIGGFEQGFKNAGYRALFLCEADPIAQRILAARFPDSVTAPDVRDLDEIPQCDVITAGFPCQDLSQAGRTAGISGRNSSLVREVFRLIERAGAQTKWLIIENVPFMLRLQKGKAIKEITDSLRSLGWQWAYRTIDAQAFGLPQRRRRVFLLASRTEDPRPPLFGQDVGEKRVVSADGRACGFYWTEGHKGLGWAVDAIPPLKGGSGLSIPSPPAIWLSQGGNFVIPSIEDAERLQGFTAGWTNVCLEEGSIERARWRLIGNAVSVPVAEWLAKRLGIFATYDSSADIEISNGQAWPEAAWCVDGRLAEATVSTWPIEAKQISLASFLSRDCQPLSQRAARGFLARLEHSGLRVESKFFHDLRRYVSMGREKEVAKSVSRRMSSTQAKNNAGERKLRSALHERGLRFRLHQQLIPGSRRTVDIVLPSAKIAVFLDGCFWHGCPIHGTWPRKNAEWWREKIDKNRERDQDTNQHLKSAGWLVIRIWEHEDEHIAAKRIAREAEIRLKRFVRKKNARPNLKR